jgi:hypothetical protein
VRVNNAAQSPDQARQPVFVIAAFGLTELLKFPEIRRTINILDRNYKGHDLCCYLWKRAASMDPQNVLASCWTEHNWNEEFAALVLIICKRVRKVGWRWSSELSCVGLSRSLEKICFAILKDHIVAYDNRELLHVVEILLHHSRIFGIGKTAWARIDQMIQDYEVLGQERERFHEDLEEMNKQPGPFMRLRMDFERRRRFCVGNRLIHEVTPKIEEVHIQTVTANAVWQLYTRLRVLQEEAAREWIWK